MARKKRRKTRRANSEGFAYLVNAGRKKRRKRRRKTMAYKSNKRRKHRRKKNSFATANPRRRKHRRRKNTHAYKVNRKRKGHRRRRNPGRLGGILSKVTANLKGTDFAGGALAGAENALFGHKLTALVAGYLPIADKGMAKAAVTAGLGLVEGAVLSKFGGPLAKYAGGWVAGKAALGVNGIVGRFLKTPESQLAELADHIATGGISELVENTSGVDGFIENDGLGMMDYEEAEVD